MGGTEVYVQALARELVLQSHRVTVVIPSENENSRSNESLDVYEMPLAVFSDFISATNFDVVHAHPLTASQFLGYLQVCQQQEIPVVVTYHTPTLTCGRGDLLLYGQKPCDGEIRQRRCTACIFKQKGLPVSVGRLLAAIPGLGVLETIAPAGKLRSMLSIPRQVRQSRESFQQLLRLASHWVAVSKWVKKVLEINGWSAENISVCRQACCHERTDLADTSKIELGVFGKDLKVGFVGRIHPYKGLHILLKALQYLPLVKLEVHIVGDRLDIEPEYLRLLERESCDDPRIKWWGKLEPEFIPGFIEKMDVLVVPSLWMETGPMTVLEAWTVGVPIVGSDRGGIREWVNEYGGGWLFPAGDSSALASILQQFANGQASVPALPKVDRLPAMRTLARLMENIYEEKVFNKVPTNRRCSLLSQC